MHGGTIIRRTECFGVTEVQVSPVLGQCQGIAPLIWCQRYTEGSPPQCGTLPGTGTTRSDTQVSGSHEHSEIVRMSLQAPVRMAGSALLKSIERRIGRACDDINMQSREGFQRLQYFEGLATSVHTAKVHQHTLDYRACGCRSRLEGRSEQCEARSE
ncbi:hypothetical protein NS2R_08865 [Pseudomonas oryzihabitans]|nr:hypothetical protein NS2R_08865 [Pseudomonas psychrotolerans]